MANSPRASHGKSADRAASPIVSSAHLAAGALPSLSELEFGLILLGHAFDRWMVRCMAAAGVPDLSPLDVLVAHTIAHRDKPKRIADICLVLSIEETHVVTYSVKKLEGLGLVTSSRSGNEKSVSPHAQRRGRDPHLYAPARAVAGVAGEERRQRSAAPVRGRGADARDVGSLRSGGARRGEPLDEKNGSRCSQTGVQTMRRGC